jgi:DNA-binding NarL/FixJ family response regulator
MAIALLVCDDSMMARKQLIRALPPEWPVSISQACHGEEAMLMLRQGVVEVMLLDLTMPVMDGFEVLAALRSEGLSPKVIVVSGDVQEEAIRRVTELGALAFIKKPAAPGNCGKPSNALAYSAQPQPTSSAPNQYRRGRPLN